MMLDRRTAMIFKCALTIVLCCAALRQAEAKILAQWVQPGPDGSSSIRAITDDACPSIIFDGTAVPRTVRSDPQKFGGVKPAQFQVRSCEAPVQAGSVTAVSTASLCRCLNPIRGAASRVRARIEAVLDYAKARNYRDGDNPARWKGHLETLLAEAAGYPRPGPHGSYALRRAASVHDRAAGSG
jgi:hypothetical protein